MIRAAATRKPVNVACAGSACRYLPGPMKIARSARRRFATALLLAAAAIAPGVAHDAAAADAAKDGTTRMSPTVPMEPGPDGWFDARPPDDSFRVRLPVAYRGFGEKGQTEAGVATHTVGVRANAVGAFGGATNYVASCIVQENDARSPKERLQAVVDRWEKLGLMRFRQQLDGGPHPGFDFEMADDVKVIRARIYAPKQGTCTILLSWRPFAKPSEADIAKFLDSFELTR
jgi:hypothetical protein